MQEKCGLTFFEQNLISRFACISPTKKILLRVLHNCSQLKITNLKASILRSEKTERHPNKIDKKSLLIDRQLLHSMWWLNNWTTPKTALYKMTWTSIIILYQSFINPNNSDIDFYLYDFMASVCRFSMNCWNVGNDGKLICNDGGREKGNVGLQLAVFVESRVNSALITMKIIFFSRCFAGRDDIFEVLVNK